MEMNEETSISRGALPGLVAGLLVMMLPAISAADVIWRGDFSTGDFTQYHGSTSRNEVHFHLIPAYGRPIQYGQQAPGHVGNGDLLSLVARTSRTIDGIRYPQGPTRGGEYAAKLTVKNSANGSSSADADPTGDPNRRRTQFQLQKMLSEQYNALPHMGERWLSYSVYLPANWEEKRGDWGPSLFGLKPRNDGGAVSGTLSLGIDDDSWQISHRWSPVLNPAGDDVPWQQQMNYTGNYQSTGRPYPNNNDWPNGMDDFPNVQQSYAALQSLNVGGWTDWIFHVKFDHRGSLSGGTGWATVWKREDSGPWIKVLDIRPRVISRGGMTFDRGIGYNVPRGTNNGGYGMNFGLGGSKDVYWDAARNTEIYIANIKIADGRTTFDEMTPDGSGTAPTIFVPAPNPPQQLIVE